MICPYQNVLNVTIDNSARAVFIPEISLELLQAGRDGWSHVKFILDRGMPTVGEAKDT
jgi:hypothetical protein